MQEQQQRHAKKVPFASFSSSSSCAAPAGIGEGRNCVHRNETRRGEACLYIRFFFKGMLDDHIKVLQFQHKLALHVDMMNESVFLPS